MHIFTSFMHIMQDRCILCKIMRVYSAYSVKICNLWAIKWYGCVSAWRVGRAMPKSTYIWHFRSSFCKIGTREVYPRKVKKCCILINNYQCSKMHGKSRRRAKQSYTEPHRAKQGNPSQAGQSEPSEPNRYTRVPCNPVTRTKRIHLLVIWYNSLIHTYINVASFRGVTY